MKNKIIIIIGIIILYFIDISLFYKIIVVLSLIVIRLLVMLKNKNKRIDELDRNRFKGNKPLIKNLVRW